MRTLILAAALLVSSSAMAVDRGQYGNIDPATKAWVKDLRDRDGMSCCDSADGYPAEAEWNDDTGRYRVKIDGQWFDVPDKALISQPNRLGYAVVWFMRYINRVVIRCFLPGSGG